MTVEGRKWLGGEDKRKEKPELGMGKSISLPE